MITYGLMALLVLAALAVLSQPWWRRDRATQQRRNANVAAYRTRVQEIDNELAAGMIDAATAEQLKQETGARLLQDAESADAPATQSSRGPLWLAVIVLPLFAVLWYLQAGSWRTQDLINLAKTDPAAAQQQSILAMVERLKGKLEKNPEDAEGWAMLGRSYSVLQRYTDAATAYEKANQLSDAIHADWLVGQGEALALSRDRDLTGRPRELFEAAVQREPGHVTGLFYAGLAAAQADDLATTRRHWEVLLRQPLPEDMRQLISQRLAAIPDGGAKQAEALQLRVKLSVAPALQGLVKPEQTLFVFAKAENGPPMPLAAGKLKASDLPTEIILDDSMAMMPSMKLSQFDRWVVTARLSDSGTPQAQTGDLEGSVTLGRAEAAKPIRLEIKSRVP